MSLMIGSARELNVSISEITSFYRENWPRKIALANEGFYKWQFINTPNNNNDECCVAVQGGNVIAVMGLNERSFSFDDLILYGAELTTWIVHSEKRNLGLGPKMIDYLKDKYSVLFGMGISHQALPIYLRKDFKYIKSIPRFIYPINDNVIEKFGIYTPLAKKIKNKKAKKNNYYIKSITDEELNEIYLSYSKESNLFDRGDKWFRWRYDKHPSFNYISKIISDDDGNRCVVVYRIDQLPDFNIMHCVDLYGSSSAYSAAISYLEEQAIHNNIDIIDFYSTNTKVNSVFIEKNWFSVLDYDFIDFPHLFHPLEMRTPSTTSLIMWCDNKVSGFYDVGKLYITKQDCDFDRPVASNL